MVVWSDTDFAVCARTRKSMSGGAVVFGSHCLKTYSQTQEAIALSSGESEFRGIVKAATMGIGIESLFGDLDLEMDVQFNADASAATSIASRRAAGRVRHAEVRELWVQDNIQEGELFVIKVHG